MQGRTRRDNNTTGISSVPYPKSLPPKHQGFLDQLAQMLVASIRNHSSQSTSENSHEHAR